MLQADPVPIKPSDTRSDRFIDQYGETAYELDALHPELLQKLVRKSIEAHTDMDKFAENSKIERYDIEAIDLLKDDVLEFIDEKMDGLEI